MLSLLTAICLLSTSHAGYDKLVEDDWDGYNARVSPVGPIQLGKHSPDGNLIKIKFTVTGKNPKSKNTYLGMDYAVLK